jgi:uncharacterized protein involved in outer membrane biogenesis
MKKIPHYLITLAGYVLLPVAVLAIGLALFLPRMLDVNAYRGEIVAALQQSLHRTVTFSHGEFRWHFGPSFDFDGVTIREPDNSADFLTADRITVRVSLLPLFRKRLVLKDITLEHPGVTLIRSPDGKLNIDDLLNPPQEKQQLFFRRVHIQRGTLRWRDLALASPGISAELHNLSLSLDHLARGRTGKVMLSCQIPPLSGAPSQLTLAGTVRLPDKGKPLADTAMRVQLDARQVEIGRFWPYYARFIPFGNSGGRLDLATSFSGTLQEFAARGTVRVSGGAVTWPTVFHGVVAPRSLEITCTLKRNRTLLDVSALEMATDGFRIRGSVQIQDMGGPDPRIIAHASTPGTFRYEEIRTYVPYGIIEKTAADYIENRIKAGVFKLDTGVLDGRISQITHMERGDNCNTLLIRGTVQQAVLSYGPRSPDFKNIKGTLELRGKNFNLIGMSGTFGTSPFTMWGSITEYNTDKRSEYPAHMEITPHGPEVLWLARLARASELAYNGTSTLLLRGEGQISAYRLSGEWDLQQAAYSFPGIVQKPGALPNRLSFSSVIEPQRTRLTSLSYTLPPLSLSASALFDYGRKPYLGFELQTNSFQLGEAAPFLTRWRQYHPRGRVQAHIQGAGSPEDFAAMEYRGSIVLGGFSFQPEARLKPVTGINSTITFQGSSLETSSMQARYGDSIINLKGRVRNLKDAEAELSLSSPRLFLRDLSLGPATSDLGINRMTATILFKERQYILKHLAGQLNGATIHASGEFKTGPTSEGRLALSSSFLDLNDLLLAMRPAAEPASGEQPPLRAPAREPPVTLTLMADAGRYDRITFTKLNSTILLEGAVTTIQHLDVGLLEGHLSGQGRIAPGNGRERRYEAGFTLEEIDAERLFRLYDISREVTGRLNLTGSLNARGATPAELKKTLSGTLNLRLEKGTLKKFNVLSKVFSILNISQLFKFQWPDMVSGGMPYNEIRGSFTVTDGIVATQDLFISSDAINVSLIGSADIAKEKLDFTIGVQPLQTVDKIINRIPVVGWLLTGKDKGFITAYFEAKGPWSEPRVTAIQTKSMAKGALNLFRRIFELPVRLFTDTGEVILGK